MSDSVMPDMTSELETFPVSNDVEDNKVKHFVPQDIAASFHSPGICGLYNLGNTCYMNSTLQCLLHDKNLLHFFLSQKYISTNKLLQEFCSLIKKYWSGKWSVIVPNSFKDAFSENHTQFLGSSQQDGQEFLALFLGSLHAELMSVSHMFTVPLLGAKICNDLTIPEISEKRKKKESFGCLNNCLLSPNGSQDSATADTNLLRITSFIGKEKKTPNVNVLNTDQECDEEITTDHSNKYPQTIGSRLNNGQPFLSSTPTNDESNREMESVVKSEVLLKKKGADICPKQTNVLADLRRNTISKMSESEMHDKEKKDIDSKVLIKLTTDCKKMKFDKIETGYCCGQHPYFEAESFQGVPTFDVNDGYYSDSDSYMPTSVLKRPTPVELPFLRCSSSPFQVPAIVETAKRRKIFSLQCHNHRPSLLPLKLSTPVTSLFNASAITTTNNWNSEVCVEHEPNSGLESLTGERGSLVTKFTNILVEEKATEMGNPFHSNLGEPSTQASKQPSNNLRCPSSQHLCKEGKENKNQFSPAESHWQDYTRKNNSVIVENFQGQLESTVQCCKCGHRSITYEPFMYLSVPIPHALQAIFDVWIALGSEEKTKISVNVPKQGKVLDLKEALSKHPTVINNHIDLNNFILCEVKKQHIVQVLENSMPLRCLSTCPWIAAIRVLSIVDEGTEDSGTPVTTSGGTWNSCCICLEDFDDSDLLCHLQDSCSVMLCHTCLQSSVEHYGLDGFSCPNCHIKSSPYGDFVPMTTSTQNREVVISVNFVCLDEQRKSKSLTQPPVLLRTFIELSVEKLDEIVEMVFPKKSSKRGDFVYTFSTLDGRSCSRCQSLQSSCSGCCFPETETVSLMPGDNIAVRFAGEFDVDEDSNLFADSRATSERKKPVTLEMCMEAFTKNETMDENNPWFCTSCSAHQLAEKQLRICRWPKTLILYIKRFLYQSKSAVKIDDEVTFPIDSFNVGSFGGTQQTVSKLYDLTACISHYGGVHSGHYTAHCRHAESNEWMLCNDEEITKERLREKDASSVYVLFYRGREET